MALILGSVYATRDTTATAASGAAAYLPTDGVRAVTRDGSNVSVTDNARLPASVAALSMPGKLNIQVISHHGDLISRGVPMWRQTATPYGSGHTQSSALFALTGRGLVQLAYSSEKLALVFDPPLLVLPDHPEDGDSWSGHGDALGGLIDYRTTTTVRREKSCWKASGSLTFTQHGSGSPMGTVPSDSRLCPGKGIVDGEAASAPALVQAGSQQSPPRAAQSPTRKPTVLPVVSPSPIGDLPISSFRLDVAPVGTSDGRLVLADAGSKDLVSTHRDGDRLTVDWRVHPGGTITSLAALGSVVVVGTSHRDLCAYDANGGWHWCRQLGDLVDRPTAVMGARTIAALGQDGVLRAVDVPTGKERWHVRGVDSLLPPVKAGHRVVVAERDGTLRAWESSTGREAWTTAATDPPSTLTTSGDEIAVDGELATRYDANGHQLTQHVLRISVDRTVLSGDTTVRSGSDGAAAFDRTGRRLWSAPRWRAAATEGSDLLMVEGAAARWVDPATGHTHAQVALPQRGGSWWVVPLGAVPVLVQSGGLVVGLS